MKIIFGVADALWNSRLCGLVSEASVQAVASFLLEVGGFVSDLTDQAQIVELIGRDQPEAVCEFGPRRERTKGPIDLQQRACRGGLTEHGH
jgi:hypothetical protein